MLPTTTTARLGERDMVVLNDLLRFGALTLEQIARRYDMRGRRQLPPLERLKHDGYVKSQPHWFSSTRFFAATAKAPIVKGFAVGRTIFVHAAEQWLAGKMSDDEAVADMASRFEQLTEAWLAARGRKAA